MPMPMAKCHSKPAVIDVAICTAVLILLADAPALDAFAVCMIVLVYADVVVDVIVPVVVDDVVMLFDPFLPDVVVDKDEIAEADADALREAVLN